MNSKLSPILAFNAGYVDTLGFLALHGLFTAHVTGNFVTIGASFVTGASGIATKLLALPTFCMTVIFCRLLGRLLTKRDLLDLRLLVGLQVGLLCAAAGTAILQLPFVDADQSGAMLTGLLLVAAMAIQNAVHRTHMAAEVPSTLMTGTTTQLLIDTVDLAFANDPIARSDQWRRLKRLGTGLGMFVLGCSVAALGFLTAPRIAFFVPPIIAMVGLSLIMRSARFLK